jgi:hypothetical protein
LQTLLSVGSDLAFNNHIPPGVHIRLIRIPEGNYQLLHLQTIQRQGWNWCARIVHNWIECVSITANIHAWFGTFSFVLACSPL